MKTIIFCVAMAMLSAVAQAQQTVKIRGMMTIFNPTTGVPNPQNPFDQIGQLHNEGLASVGNAIDWQRTSIVPQTIYDRTGDFLEGKNVTQNFATTYQRSKTGLDAIVQRRTGTQEIPAGLSPRAAEYLTKAMNALNEGDMPNPKVVAATFIRLEAEIMNDASLPKKEQDILLAGLAVGRYSVDYWTNFTTQNATALSNSGGAYTNNATSTGSKVKGIAKADLKGGILGGLEGALTGTLVGVGVGVAAGAIAGSVVEGIFTLL